MMASINQLSEWTGIDRRTITVRLRDMASEPGPKRARMYNTHHALKTLYLGAAEGERLDAAQERAALDKARRRLADLQWAEKRRDLIPVDDMRDFMLSAVVSMRSRVLSIPSRLAAALTHTGHGVEVNEIATAVIRECLTELGRIENHPDVKATADRIDSALQAELSEIAA